MDNVNICGVYPVRNDSENHATTGATLSSLLMISQTSQCQYNHAPSSEMMPMCLDLCVKDSQPAQASSTAFPGYVIRKVGRHLMFHTTHDTWVSAMIVT